MATFPALNRRELDDRQPDNGLVIILAPDGNLFGQSLYNSVFYDFAPLFVNLSNADVVTLETFEATNRTLAFDYLYEANNRPTVTYECFFKPPGIKIISKQDIIIAQAFFRGKVKP